MAIFDFISRWGNDRKARRYAEILDGNVPVFSRFGDDVYASDIVKNCIRAIAT